jgi:phosphatidylglycerol:prolipoprotein diacylglycerol transferase
VLTSFPLAVAFPGGARHDLGLDDAIALAIISVILYTVDRRHALRGRLLPLLALLYGCSRFLLDFLRATDVSYADARYLGLTPAQFAALALVGWGLLHLARPPPAPAPSDGESAASPQR